jgi:hypothetical protein
MSQGGQGRVRLGSILRKNCALTVGDSCVLGGKELKRVS